MGFRKFLQKAVEEIAETADELLESLEGDVAPSKEPPEPVHKKVLSICFDPQVPAHGNRKLSRVLRWNDVHKLMEKYIEDVREVSYGYANYSIVEHLEVDGFPVKIDGFAYDANSFLKAWQTKKGFHDPDAVDYHRILRDYDIIPQVNAGRIDEVWLWGFPYAGYYESIMAGPGAFWCNAPALEGTGAAKRRFIIMGYNYQRGVGEMLENLGHRAESILRHVYRDKKGKANLWKRFAQYDKTHPGQAEVGLMHFAPNSLKDYDWGNPTKVKSRADDWLNFPNLTGNFRVMDCSDWGEGDTRLHHKWWYERLPHVTGTTGHISNNWWEYIIDPNRVS